MNYNEEQNEETLSLKDLLMYILSKWRVLLLTILAGAILLGVYKGVSKPKVIQLSITEQQNIQDKIDENTESITNYSLTISENENIIFKNTSNIKNYETDIETQKELISNLEKIISKYNTSGLQAVETLTITNVQLADAKEKVYDYENKIEILKQESIKLPQQNELLEKKLNKLRETNTKLEESLSPQVRGISKRSIIEYAILGAFLGAVIFFGIEFFRFIEYKKLRSADELSRKYNVHVMGSLYMIPPKKNKNKIDKLINKWTNYTDTVDEGKQYRHISTAVQVMSSGKNKKIILTGTVDKTLISEVRNKLIETLPQNEYELYVVANPVYDEDALLNIKESTVILVEAKDVSNTHEIRKLIDILHTGKAEVLGAVMM